MEKNYMTAVDWLVNELKSYTFHERVDMAEWGELKKLSIKAKQMEKEQIINFGNDLLAQNDRSYIGFPDLAEQYYNETYNK